ncbi:MAG: hypothetical protein KJ645_08600, partial [Planctomycetes bacterium]|nr:hypothetical protein [Planctomycetota bacterium]
MRGFAKAAGGVMMSRVLATLLGIFNTVLLANRFGNSISVDAFFVAQIIPIGASLSIRHAVNMCFIPSFVQFRTVSGEDEAWKRAANFFNFLLLLFLAASAVLYFFAPAISTLMAPGFSHEGRMVCTRLLRILAPVLFLSCVGASVESLFNAYHRFLIPAYGMLMIPFGTLAGLIFLSDGMGINGVVTGMSLGALAQ